MKGDFKPPINLPENAIICSNCNYSDLRRSKEQNSCENYFESCEWHMKHNTDIKSLPSKCKDYVRAYQEKVEKYVFYGGGNPET